ncbi:MAG: gamma-glutamylcyclotransferase [Candidatus Micrarchaeota archaeon]|nr:gamma-glutamylcyclotransferase [Candidatus Micrarchaeota archaeon]
MDWVRLAFIILCAACAGLLLMAFLHIDSRSSVALFAYGPSASKSTIAKKAGGFDSAEPAVVEGYRIAFQTSKKTEFGVANLVPDENGIARGAVYRMAKHQLEALQKSHWAGFWRRMPVKAKLADGSEVLATAFVLEGEAADALPSRPYLEAAIESAREFHKDGGAEEILQAIRRN